MGSMVFLTRVSKDHDGIHRAHRQEDARQTTNLPKRVMATSRLGSRIPVVSRHRSFIHSFIHSFIPSFIHSSIRSPSFGHGV